MTTSGRDRRALPKTGPGLQHSFPLNSELIGQWGLGPPCSSCWGPVPTEGVASCLGWASGLVTNP